MKKTVPQLEPRGRPPKISRGKMVDAVLELGVADLTLVRVADYLGVTIQALYHHVKSRDELLQLTSEVLAERFPMPEDTGKDWCDWMYDLAHALTDAYRHAPGLASLLVAKSPMDAPTVLRRWERSLRIANRSGFDFQTALWATLAVHEFTYSWVAREEQRRERLKRTVPAGTRRRPDSKTSAAGGKHLDLAAQAIRQAQEHSAERFEFTLRALLTGLSGCRKPLPKPGEKLQLRAISKRN